MNRTPSWPAAGTPLRAAAALLADADRVLRGARGASSHERSEPLVRLGLLVVGGGGLYGAAMGTYGGDGGQRLLQMLYSAVKVPLLIGVTAGLSLPGFFVLYTLFGLRDDFPRVLRALATTQAGVTLILASLAPFTLLWYASATGHQQAVLFNAAMFGAASLGGQWLLRRHCGPLIAADPRHAWLLRLWFGVYGFVGVQMGWVLRPFVGSPGIPTRFLREDSWGNAYIEVSKMVGNVLGG